MERIKDSSVMKQKKAVWGVSRRRCGVGRGLPSLGQLQLMVGKRHCSRALFGVICAVRGRMWHLCVCVQGDCICRGIMCSLNFLRYWRSRSLCALFYICRSMQFFFFLPLCWDLIRQRTQGRRGGLLQEPFVPLSLLPLQLFFILSTVSFPPAALSSFSFGSLFLGSS